jgi:hypothetical protein
MRQVIGLMNESGQSKCHGQLSRAIAHLSFSCFRDVGQCKRSKSIFPELPICQKKRARSLTSQKTHQCVETDWARCLRLGRFVIHSNLSNVGPLLAALQP